MNNIDKKIEELYNNMALDAAESHNLPGYYLNEMKKLFAKQREEIIEEIYGVKPIHPDVPSNTEDDDESSMIWEWIGKATMYTQIIKKIKALDK